MKTANTKQARMEARDAKIAYLLEQGWEYEKRGDCDLIILTQSFENHCVAMGFKGSALKPWFYYRFKTIERRIEFVNERVEFLKENCAKKSRKSPDAKDHFEVGDVLFDSWGYDQTNVDWFQVTKVKGKSIWLRPICENSSDAGNCSYGYTQPRRNHFKGEEFRKTVQPDGYVCSPLRGSLRKWDGKPQYCSSYH
tara:strand:- start:260 stop:844 length:585 start_codon:yes stop_codon:yes gene_type:complete